MSKVTKTLDRLLRSNADANIRFADLCTLLTHLGFDERIRGDHHIFTREGVMEILNLQPRGDKAKPYQVKQVRGIILAYGLAGVMEQNMSPTEEPSGSDVSSTSTQESADE